MIVCICFNVSESRIRSCIQACRDLKLTDLCHEDIIEEIAFVTGAGCSCGACNKMIRQLIQEQIND